VRKDLDPVDSALMCLRSKQWTGESHRNQLEEKLMSEFDTQRLGYGTGRRRTLMVAGLAALLLGAAAFAATRGWFAVTVIDGKVVDTREITLPEGGVTTFQVPVQSGKATTVTVSGQASADGGEVQVNVTSDGQNANVEVKDKKPQGDD